MSGDGGVRQFSYRVLSAGVMRDPFLDEAGVDRPLKEDPESLI